MFLYLVRCAGTESSLLNCSHSGIGYYDDYFDFYYYRYYRHYHYCHYYYDDAGVVCPSRKLCVWHKYRDSHFHYITVGLVLATMNTLIMLKFLPTVQLYSLQSYTYCPICDFDQSLDEIYA